MIEDWNEDITHQKRIIWTQWYGVPLKARNARFFKLVSAKFGNLMHIDEATAAKKNLSTARILIKTPLPNLPSSDLAINIDGRIHHIKIIEEISFSAVDFHSDTPFPTNLPPYPKTGAVSAPPPETRGGEKSKISNLAVIKEKDLVGFSEKLGHDHSPSFSRKSHARGKNNDSTSSNNQSWVGPTFQPTKILSRGVRLEVSDIPGPSKGPFPTLDLNRPASSLQLSNGPG